MSQQSIPVDNRNYILRVSLKHFKDPQVFRTLSVPPSATFHKLHHAIQIAFQWDNAHLYNFQVFDVPAISPRNASTRRRSMHPRVLLRLDGPGADFGEFDFDEVESKNSKRVRLFQVFERARYKDKAMEYLYDLGAEWNHSIILIGRAEENTSNDIIECLDGEGGPIPEYDEDYDSDRDEEPLEWDKSAVNEGLANIDEQLRLEEMFERDH